MCACVRACTPTMHVRTRVSVECRCECSRERGALCPSLSPGEEAVHKGLRSSRGLFKFGRRHRRHRRCHFNPDSSETHGEPRLRGRNTSADRPKAATSGFWWQVSVFFPSLLYVKLVVVSGSAVTRLAGGKKVSFL